MDNTISIKQALQNVKQPTGFEFKKRCPKCNSKGIYVDKDFAGIFESCILCGYTHDVNKEDK
jgi:transcription elongation factor Elf1